MKDKAGILTFHRSRNYGAILQAYALQQAVLKIGIESELIDYYNAKIESELYLWKLEKWTVSNCIYSMKQFVFRTMKKKGFDNFIDTHMAITSKSYFAKEELLELQDEYKWMIAGSDQVWNLDITGEDTCYFLDFAGENTRKIGYAVSAGDGALDALIRMEDLVKKFDYITVREQKLGNFINKALGVDVEVACDPTLLLPKEQYIKLFKKKKEASSVCVRNI